MTPMTMEEQCGGTPRPILRLKTGHSCGHHRLMSHRTLLPCPALILGLLLASMTWVRADGGVEVRDCEGAAQRPLALQGRRAVVLIFTLCDCPVANSMAPAINRLVAAYTNFAFYLVHADPDTTAAEARRHAADYGYKSPVLLDPHHRLVKLAGATKTPEAVVLDASAKVLYRGRINDLYAALGKRRPEPTRHDLRDALDALAAGRRVGTARTAVIGCYIPEAAK